jgi:hypothetical protein
MMHPKEGRSSMSKCLCETEAEAVAFVVCCAIGMGTGTATRDYVGLYGGDAKLFGENLEYIERTATPILNAIGAEPPPLPPV